MARSSQNPSDDWANNTVACTTAPQCVSMTSPALCELTLEAVCVGQPSTPAQVCYPPSSLLRTYRLCSYWIFYTGFLAKQSPNGIW